MIQKARQVSLKSKGESLSILEIENGINNTLTVDGLDDMFSILSELSREEDPRVVMITGKGARSFCMGYSSNCNEERENSTIREARNLALSIARVIRASRHYFVSAVNGFAFDFGLEIIISSDLVIASSRANLGMPGLHYGMPPFTGILTDTAIDISGEAYSAIKSGRIIEADEAYRLKLVDNIIDSSNFARDSLNYCNSLNPDYLANFKSMKHPDIMKIDADRLFFQVYRVSCKSIMDLERFRNSL